MSIISGLIKDSKKGCKAQESKKSLNSRSFREDKNYVLFDPRTHT